MTSTDPIQLREPPRFSRDVAVHAWISVKALSDAGDAIWTIALAWTAVQITSPAVAGVIVAAGAVPRAVVLLFGGVLADRADARHVMIAFNAVRVAVLIGTAAWVLSHPPTVLVLLLAAVAFGICDAFYEPSAATIGRRLVRVDDLPAYSAVMQTATRLGTMGGAALGGFLVAYAGIAGSASLNALTFTLVIAFIAIWLRPRFALVRAARESALRGIVRGFAHLKEAPTTRTLVIALSGLNLAVGPATGIGIALRAHEEGWGAEAVGVLEALIGFGAALGALAVTKWRPRREALGGFGALVAQGAGIILVGAGPVWSSGIGCLLIGLTAGFASVLLSATFAATVDTAYLGRMSAITRLGDDVLMPLAMAAFGALAAATEIWIAFTVFGCALMAMMWFPLRNPRFRELTLRR
ncbi:MFS family permease [Microbacterium ginsengiterrae]|uniref:MFS family permease n=1 Tax=Microbacterium ginsengiterrae TaxID=546115 RepID=A0A7W9CEX2_9MICO|nr:MFS transporter [Microbacterium ginsengiterrae]MBB5744002.1 MFS family permease [Microbacterium ginsengiterrae]